MSHRKIWLLCIVALLVAMFTMPAGAQFNLNLGGRDPFGEAKQIYVSDGYAYVCIESTLLILKVGSGAPTRVGAIEVPDTANGVFVLGNYAYVAYGDDATTRNLNGLFIVNVYNPAAPGKVGQYPMNDPANGVFVVGSVAYVTSDDYLYGINVSNRSNPIFSWVSDNLGAEADPVFVYDGFAYVGAGHALRRIDVTTKDVSVPLDFGGDVKGIFAIRRSSDNLEVAYVAAGNAGVHVVDISGAAMAQEGSAYYIAASAESVHGTDEIICAAIDGFGLIIFDDDLDNETTVSTEGSSAMGVSVYGNNAYVADGGNGVCTVTHLSTDAYENGYYVPYIDEDNSRVWEPGETIFDNANGVYAYGGYAYVASSSSLRIINVSKYYNPTASSGIHTSGQANDVFVHKNTASVSPYYNRVLAYVADDVGLCIIDVTNPSSPVYVRDYAVGGARRIHVVERGSGTSKRVYAFVACMTNGLYMLDVTDPENIEAVETNYHISLDSVKGVFVVGDYVYMVGLGAPNLICIVKIVEQPTLGLEFDDSGGKKPYTSLLGHNPNDVYVSGNYAFVAVEGGNDFGGDGGLWIVDVNDPEYIQDFVSETTNFADTQTPATGIHVSGSFAYVTSDGGSFHVFDASNPAAPNRIKLDKSPDHATGVFVLGNYAYVTDEVKGLYVYAANTNMITATADDNGRISPSGVIQVANGGEQTFRIRPDREYSIRDVRVNGRSIGVTDEYTFRNVYEDQTISARFEETRYTITATAGSNGAVYPTSVQNIRSGDDVKFTFTPSTGYDVGTVKVDGLAVILASPNEYTFPSVRDDHTLEVTFVAKQFTITAAAGENGSISPSGEVEVVYGGGHAFSIVPAVGYAVKDVLVDGESQGAESSHVFTNVAEDHTISATFGPIHFITATSGSNGIISPTGIVQVADGGSQKFTLTPIEGYHVADVIINDISTGVPTPSTEYTFPEVLTDQTIEVLFAVNAYVIEATAGANGTIEPSGDVGVTHGGSKAFTITPNVGYSIKDVRVDGVSVGAVSVYTLTNVIEGHKIDASFEIKTYDITATAGENGTISPLGTVSADHGSSKTFAIVPNTGYHVVDVVVDGVSVGAVTTYTIENITSTHTISATFEINTYTITLIIEKDEDVLTTEIAANYLESKTFTFNASPGYHVEDVSIDSFSLGRITFYTVVGVKANRTLKVVYAIDTYILRSSTSGHGTITPMGETRVAYQGSATYDATPEVGYQISYVKIDGELVDIEFPYTFENVAKNHAILVVFVRSVYEITATAGENGRISPSGLLRHIYGASQTFAITPDVGYAVSDVLVDGVSVGAVTSHTFSNIGADHTIEAQFALKTYTITATAGENGSISPLGEVHVVHGTGVTFTIASDPNYHVAEMLVDGRAFIPADEYKFENVTADHTIAVKFAIDTYTITASAGMNGRISPAGAVKVNHGADQTFTMIPIVGQQVADVKVDGVSVGAVDSYTFTEATADHTINATFEAKTYTITALVEGPGAISPAGDVKVTHDGMKIFVIKANSGASLVDVIIDGNSMGSLLAYQFTNVVVNHTILAIFEQKENALMQNFPNPFNPETWIPFELKENSEVKVRIYNSTGRLVKELDLGSKVAGIYATPDKAAYWDGKDESGVSVASGVYFYSIQAGKFSAVKKMIVSK